MEEHERYQKEHERLEKLIEKWDIFVESVNASKASICYLCGKEFRGEKYILIEFNFEKGKRQIVGSYVMDKICYISIRDQHQSFGA